MFNKVGISNILLTGDVDASFSQHIADSFVSLVKTNTNLAMRQYTVKLKEGLEANVKIRNDNAKETQSALS